MPRKICVGCCSRSSQNLPLTWDASAAAASLVHHAATWLPVILIAAVVMGREGLGVHDLTRAVRSAVGAAPGGSPR